MSRGKKAGCFEDLIAWEKAKTLFLIIYRVSSVGAINRDFSFRNQLRRAALSVSSNIAEGYGRHSIKEFLRFLSISNGSAFEVRSQVRLARELNYIGEEDTKELIALCYEISRLLGGLRRARLKSLST